MADLSYTCEFDSTIVLDNWITPNKYKCEIYFDVETDNGDHQNIAFDRCKIMIEALFHNSMIINLNNPMIQILAKKTKQRFVTLPAEPIDLILSSIIFHKLNAIVEEKISIQKVKLTSSQSESIWVHFDTQFAEDFGKLDCELYNIVESKPWWQRSDPSTGDWFEINKKEIKFHLQQSNWEKDLQWEDVSSSKKNLRWKPEIINGGKTQH